MENPYVLPLSLLVFLPTIGAFFLLFFGRDNHQGIKYFTLIVTIAVFLLNVYMALPAPEGVAPSYETLSRLVPSSPWPDWSVASRSLSSRSRQRITLFSTL